MQCCFTQFAKEGPGKKHGFARNSENWQVVDMQGDAASSGWPATTLRLVGHGNEDADWPNSFVLDMTLTLGEESLRQTMKVTNTNPSGEAFSFTTALHTYFAVGDASKTHLTGVKGLTYHTANEAKTGSFEEDRELATMAELTDRIYYSAPGKICAVLTYLYIYIMHATPRHGLGDG